ncbi:hypothetical protein ACLI5Y_16605 [Enterococcus innesii]|uniref:hypothetical protein n=1 Tax=Enterococcus innesii TaxID=2839759 RepID=UPI003985473C
MKTFAVDFAFYDFGDLIFTMKWIHAKTEGNAIDQLLKEHRNIHVQDIREIRDYIK